MNYSLTQYYHTYPDFQNFGSEEGEQRFLLQGIGEESVKNAC